MPVCQYISISELLHLSVSDIRSVYQYIIKYQEYQISISAYE